MTLFFHVHTWLLKKNIALTIQTFVDKVMSLFFNMLSSFVMAFLPKSKCVLILWLQSLSTVILEPKKKSVTVFIFSPSIIYHKVMGLYVMLLVFWMLSFKPKWKNWLKTQHSHIQSVRNLKQETFPEINSPFLLPMMRLDSICLCHPPNTC